MMGRCCEIFGEVAEENFYYWAINIICLRLNRKKEHYIKKNNPLVQLFAVKMAVLKKVEKNLKPQATKFTFQLS